jgi:hypothetical protein
LAAFGITTAPDPDLERWRQISETVANPDGEVTVAVVGKYTGLKDAYKSLSEALVHGGIANKVKVNLEWIESQTFESQDAAAYLEDVHGILVPGGFGERGSEGKIQAARYARTRIARCEMSDPDKILFVSKNSAVCCSVCELQIPRVRSRRGKRPRHARPSVGREDHARGALPVSQRTRAQQWFAAVGHPASLA